MAALCHRKPRATGMKGNIPQFRTGNRAHRRARHRRRISFCKPRFRMKARLEPQRRERHGESAAAGGSALALRVHESSHRTTGQEDALTHLTRVLCAVDIDDRGRQVFAHALTLAVAQRASLRVLHAASPDVAFNHGADERSMFFDELRRMATAVGIELQVTVQRGTPAEIIVLHARAKRPDLLVIGASAIDRRRGLSGWTIERVLRDASCPTLVVPHGRVTPSTALDRIVCAVDFSDPSLAAAREAMQLASPERTVTLLHVVEGPTPHQRLYYGWRSTDGYYREQRAVALDKLRFLVPPPLRGAVTTQVLVGEPVGDILGGAREMQASVLMIGAGGRSRLGSRLFGRTAALLRDAPCPIVAVPAQSARAEREPTRRLAA